MEEALESANYMDYLQDFRIMCELLESMEEYANWEKILTAIEEYADSVSYVNAKMFSVEMWMKYYKATGDSEKYKQKCVEHADIYFEMQKDEYEDRIRNLDLKIELQQKEKARRLAIPNLNSKVSDIVTLSAGFKCGIVGEGNTINELLDGADKCLYTVKRSGKDGYKIEL